MKLEYSIKVTYSPEPTEGWVATVHLQDDRRIVVSGHPSQHPMGVFSILAEDISQDVAKVVKAALEIARADSSVDQG